MKIKIKKLAEYNKNINITEAIALYNCSIGEWVKSILTHNPWTDEQYKKFFTQFMEIIESTYPNKEGDYIEILNNIDKESQELLEGTEDNAEKFAYYSAIEIGINSECSQPYTLVDKTTLICAVAKHFKIKFDFS